jgi:type IV secretion system protein VirB11
MAVSHHNSESQARGISMLRTAMGPAIAGHLADPSVVEVMLNPDGRLWIDRLSEGLSDTGDVITLADAERIMLGRRCMTVPRVSRPNCRPANGSRDCSRPW